MQKRGLIVKDLMGGDAGWVVVDEALWNQIRALRDDPAMTDTSRKNHRGKPAWNASKFSEWVGALTCVDMVHNVAGWPDGCPPRAGKIVRRFYTQAPVIEDIDDGGLNGSPLNGVVGVLTL
jgi:hypothetical protein